MSYQTFTVPHKNGLEPLNGVIFMSSTKKFLNFTSILLYVQKNVPCHVEHFSCAMQNKHFGSLCFPNCTGRWFRERCTSRFLHHSAVPPVFLKHSIKRVREMLIDRQLWHHKFHMMYVSGWYVIPRTRYLEDSWYSYQEI